MQCFNNLCVKYNNFWKRNIDGWNLNYVKLLPADYKRNYWFSDRRPIERDMLLAGDDGAIETSICKSNKTIMNVLSDKLKSITTTHIK